MNAVILTIYSISMQKQAYSRISFKKPRLGCNVDCGVQHNNYQTMNNRVVDVFSTAGRADNQVSCLYIVRPLGVAETQKISSTLNSGL